MLWDSELCFHIREQFNFYRNFRERIIRIEEWIALIPEEEITELEEAIRSENYAALISFHKRLQLRIEQAVRQQIENRKNQ